jgi:hypothetical protein
MSAISLRGGVEIVYPLGADSDTRQRRPDVLTRDDPGSRSPGSYGERATTLVPSYKRDLDRNRSVLGELEQELASRTYRLTEVRILDLLIWSLSAAT